MEMETTAFRPPYMSFQTFWNFIDELAGKPLPPRVDRSIMTSKSGTDQANLKSALTSFELTDAEGNVRPDLTNLVQMDQGQRAVAFRDLIRKHYAGPLRVSEQVGTPADLNKAFSDDYPSIASGDTRRKAVTFFLHAARGAGIELSPHFPITRSGSGAPGAPKAKRSSSRKRQNNDGGGSSRIVTPPPPGGGHTQTVTLESGGTVTLNYDVNMFKVSDADERFVLDLIKKLRTYRSGSYVPDNESEDGAS